MNRAAKIVIVLLCSALCGAASFVASNQVEQRPSQKSSATPVGNREQPPRIWLQA
jgi:ABC-type enterobactin transport system permease subunit